MMKIFLIISFLALVSIGHSACNAFTNVQLNTVADGQYNVTFDYPDTANELNIYAIFSNTTFTGCAGTCDSQHVHVISGTTFQSDDMFLISGCGPTSVLYYNVSDETNFPSCCSSATYLSTLPTPTPTFTRTGTFTFSPTTTPTPTKTITNTHTYSPTITRTFSVTDTPHASDTFTTTGTYTITLTPTPTITPTWTPTNTVSPTSTGTWTNTITDTFTFSPTQSATLTVSQTHTFTPTATRTLTPSPYLVTAYYNDISFTSFICNTLTSQVNFFFSATFNMPAIPSGVNPNTWACTYTGMIIPTTTEAYTFQATVDDGVVITMDGFDVISSWGVKSPTTFTSAARNFTSGTPVYVRIQYYHDSVDFSQLNLKWKAASYTSNVYKVVPGIRLWH